MAAVVAAATAATEEEEELTKTEEGGGSGRKAEGEGGEKPPWGYMGGGWQGAAGSRLDRERVALRSKQRRRVAGYSCPIPGYLQHNTFPHHPLSSPRPAQAPRRSSVAARARPRQKPHAYLPACEKRESFLDLEPTPGPRAG